MKQNRKHSIKIVFAVMACFLCGCQEKQDTAAETEIELPWESVSENVGSVTESIGEDPETTDYTNIDTDSGMEISVPDRAAA